MGISGSRARERHRMRTHTLMDNHCLSVFDPGSQYFEHFYEGNIDLERSPQLTRFR